MTSLPIHNGWNTDHKIVRRINLDSDHGLTIVDGLSDFDAKMVWCYTLIIISIRYRYLTIPKQKPSISGWCFEQFCVQATLVHFCNMQEKNPGFELHHHEVHIRIKGPIKYLVFCSEMCLKSNILTLRISSVFSSNMSTIFNFRRLLQIIS